MTVRRSYPPPPRGGLSIADGGGGSATPSRTAPSSPSDAYGTASPWQGRIPALKLIIAAFIALIAAPAFAQTFPAFTGLVVDAANVLPADRKAALEQKLEAFQQRTGRQVVVATIADLQGYPIEDYGYRLGRAWGVGLKDADNGAILIVAPAERKMRIEVGRRLEPVLTDAVSSVIIQTKLRPAFKSGDLPGGIDAGADAIIAQLSLPDEQAKAEAAKAAQAFDQEHKRSASSGGLPLGLIFWAMVIGFVILAMIRRRAGGQRYHAEGASGGGSWPIWLWAASEMLDGNRNRGGWGGGSSGGGIFGGGGGGSDGSWGGGGFTGGGGGDFGGGGASGDW